jgi:2-C-methyl-D-erythritol 4-phosphate cytidylyltransferase
MIAALIVAAGRGVRMGSRLRKQYVALAGQPILTHTLRAFDACALVDRIVLVVPGEEMDFCRQEIVAAAGLRCAAVLVAGGDRRQASVSNGLESIPEQEGIVLIHDGVRPLVTGQLIEACIDGAQRWDACIPVVGVTDTLKRVDAQGNIEGTVAREALRMAQTPQAFRLSLIRQAHRLARQRGLQATDDAALVEQMGVAVRAIPGSATNIKITTALDLQRAEAYCRRCAINGR